MSVYLKNKWSKVSLIDWIKVLVILVIILKLILNTKARIFICLSKKKNFLAFRLNKRFDNNIDCFDIKSNNRLKIFIYLFIIKKTRF